MTERFMDRLAVMKQHIESAGKEWFGHFEDTPTGTVFIGMNREERRDMARNTKLASTEKKRNARRRLANVGK